MSKNASGYVHFHYQTPPFYFPDRNRLKKFILSLFKKEGQRIDRVDYIFCTDEYLLPLNQQHLQHNTYTDVITFNLTEVGTPLIGEIYISIERIKENSLIFNVPFKEELHRVIFHGALHLCGYKDKTKKEINRMRSLENHLLKKYFPRGTSNNL